MRAIRRHPFLSIIAFLAVVLVSVLVATFVAVWRAAHTDDASTVERADAILVLGAAEYDGQPSPVFAGRLEHAQLLYDQHRAPLVMVLGGGSRATSRRRRRPAGTTWSSKACLPTR